MTPLPRWVLLAMLLALVAAHPTDHACVRLCRARNTSPEIMGVCEHRQKLVLQSSGGRFPIQRLFRLCLTPCHGAGTSNSLLFDDSRVCRTFRETLVIRHGCSCDSLSYEKSEKLEEEQWRVKEFETNRLKKRIDESNMSKQADEEEAVVPADVENRQDRRDENTMRISQAEEGTSNRADVEYTATVDFNIGPLMERTDLSQEDPVDWDQWCMTQCDNGQGGSACNCDIIP